MPGSTTPRGSSPTCCAEAAKGRDVLGMALAGVVRCLHDDRDASHRGVREQLGEGRLADQPGTDVRVPVAVRTALIPRIIGVYQLKPVPDRLDEGVEHLAHATGLRDIVSGGPGVARVEADPQPRMPSGGVEVAG